MNRRGGALTVFLVALVMLNACAALRTSVFSLPDPPPVPKHIHLDSERKASSEAVYLTDYLDNPAQGRAALQVKSSLPFPSAQSAGFVTINASCNANMFFLYQEAQVADPSKAPVVVWLQGGPGGTSMFGAIIESGAWNLTSEMKIVPREWTWTKFANMIYVDNPIGTGYSFGDPSCWVYTQKQVADNLVEMFKQFFTVYDNLADNDFFIAAESYGGKYGPAFAAKVIQYNDALAAGKEAGPKINLKGMSIGDGLSDPITQIPGYMTLFAGFSIASLDQLQDLASILERTEMLIEAGEWAEASHLFNIAVDGPVNATFSDLFQIYSGCANYFDMRTCSTPSYGVGNWEAWLNSTDIRETFNVGSHYFQTGAISAATLQDDLCKSVKEYESIVLNDPSVNVLLYNGQDDLIVGAPLTLNMLYEWGPEWHGWMDWIESSKVIWKAPADVDGVAGYAKVGGGLAHVTLRDAGHIAPYDQPQNLYLLLQGLVTGSWPWQ